MPTDIPITRRDPETRRLFASRAPEPGELYDYARGKFLFGNAEMAHNGIPIARTSADIIAAKKSGTPADILALEGGGFAENRSEAIEDMYGLGVRIIQPVHYNHYNPFGDIQGKSDFGRANSGRQTLR